MINHVLVPLDGSQFAEKALPVARQVIKSGGHIILLTAITSPAPPVYAYPSSEVMHEIEDDMEYLKEAQPHAQEYMERVAQKLRLQGYEVSIEVVTGDPASAIIHAAEHLHVEMVIMSTHGRSGLSRFLFGSVTLKVLSECPIPVLVIPNREREEVEEPAPAPGTGPTLAT